jgi:hypothetical protein
MAGKDKISSEAEIETLRKQVAALEAKLVDQQQANDDARMRAHFVQNDNEEVPTGREIEMPKCVGYEVISYHDDGRPILKPKWAKEKVPTFMYKIDMPPVGGMDIKVNGVSYQHGEVYEFDLHTLRLVKDIVYRLRDHEANIHGSNENAYRRPTQAKFSGKTGGRVH